jgi:hypothetical protein
MFPELKMMLISECGLVLPNFDLFRKPRNHCRSTDQEVCDNFKKLSTSKAQPINFMKVQLQQIPESR